MNPDERKLLLDNNQMLRKLLRAQRWSQFWGFVRILLFIVPLILGYVYLQPYFGTIGQSLQQAEGVLNQFR